MTYFQYPKKWTSAKKCEYDGKQYDSKFEAGYAQELTLRRQAGDILGFSSHKKMELDVNGYHICNYYIDFVVYHLDGLVEYVETKGWETPIWKLKWKLFEALYADKPGVKLTLIKQGR